jgi:hypothetical protein
VSGKVSIADYAAKIVAPEYQMPLMTVSEACEKVGWTFQDKPECCGAPIEIRSIFGDAYHGYCETCRRFIQDVLGPRFGNSWVQFIDTEKID